MLYRNISPVWELQAISGNILRGFYAEWENDGTQELFRSKGKGEKE